MWKAIKSLSLIAGVTSILWMLPSKTIVAQEQSNFLAMTWQGKDSLITSLYQGGAPSLAFVFINQAYNYEKSQPNINPEALSVFTHWMGIRYLSENQPDSASFYLAETLNLFRIYPEIGDTLYAQVLINSFITDNIRGNFSGALKNLREAVQYLENINYTGNWRLENLFSLIDYEIKYGSKDSAEIHGRKATNFGNPSNRDSSHASLANN